MDPQGVRLDRAGRLIAGHAMVWVRTLPASVDDIWPVVSSQTGLGAWWLVPPSAFELKVGGVFRHHWENTITGFEAGRFIDFDEPLGAYRGTGGMRFELAAKGRNETSFMFLATWGPEVRAPEPEAGAPPAFNRQIAGPGTPWPGVAAGWHEMLDRLERRFDAAAPTHGFDDLCAFYVPWLEDQFRWLDMVQRAPGAPRQA